MKKIFLLLAALTIMGCSSDDKEPQSTCEIGIYGYGRQPQPDGTTKYFLNYGTSNNNTPVYEVNESTYYYYYNLSQTTNDVICWDGPK